MGLYYGLKGDGLLYRLRLREVGSLEGLAEEVRTFARFDERLVLFPPDKGLVVAREKVLWLQVVPRLPIWTRYGPKRIRQASRRAYLGFVSPTQLGTEGVLEWSPPAGFALILGVYTNHGGAPISPPYLGLWGKGTVGHPRLPNVYETGKVCMGEDLYSLEGIRLNPFTFLKPVIHLLFSGKWNQDLYRTSWDPFNLWDANQKQVYDFWGSYAPLELDNQRGAVDFTDWAVVFCKVLYDGGTNLSS